MTSGQAVAVVTGGLGGLGQAVVHAFLEDGCRVVVPHRFTAPRVPPLLLTYGDRLQLLSANVSVEKDVQAFYAEVRRLYGRVDYLINVAGAYAGGTPIDEVSMEEWHSMFSANLESAFLMSRQAIPMMRVRRFGRIISIASMPAVNPSAKKGPYAIAKRGVISLTEIIADEVKGSGITANAIAPGIIVTDENRKAMPGADISTWVTPQDLAGIILFLCGPHGGAINGSVIKTFGGL